MSSAAASLESLQYLLQYMDANRRFEISNRCPALRDFEKSVPLHIKSLVFRESCVFVNGTKYNLGIIRKYNVGEAPEYISDSNAGGGIPFEVDEYGYEDVSDYTTLTPGDLEICRRLTPRQENDDVNMRLLENKIQRYEGKLAERRERRPSASRDIWKENLLQAHRERLFAYQCRQNNVPPNYDHFLQLTTSRTTDEQDHKTVERYAHNKKISEAKKQLTTVLFGGRISPIHVKKLIFDCLVGIIRLPVGLNFKIERLMFRGPVETTLEASAPIVHESSFPLKKLEVNIRSADELTNPIVRTAEILKIRLIRRTNLRTISTITNPVVHIIVRDLSEQTLEEFVVNWIETERPIGFEYTIGLIIWEPCFEKEMEDVLKRLNGVPIDDDNVIIPMSDDTQLKISYGPFPEFAPHCNWAVKLVTEVIQHG